MQVCRSQDILDLQLRCRDSLPPLLDPLKGKPNFVLLRTDSDARSSHQSTLALKGYISPLNSDALSAIRRKGFDSWLCSLMMTSYLICHNTEIPKVTETNSICLNVFCRREALGQTCSAPCEGSELGGVHDCFVRAHIRQAALV